VGSVGGEGWGLGSAVNTVVKRIRSIYDAVNAVVKKDRGYSGYCIA
jgi:hypothetical protein